MINYRHGNGSARLDEQRPTMTNKSITTDKYIGLTRVNQVQEPWGQGSVDRLVSSVSSERTDCVDRILADIKPQVCAQHPTCLKRRGSRPHPGWIQGWTHPGTPTGGAIQVSYTHGARHFPSHGPHTPGLSRESLL